MIQQPVSNSGLFFFANKNAGKDYLPAFVQVSICD
jgi:hypothetical protein